MELSISFVGSFLVSAKASMGSLLYNQRGVHQKHWIQDKQPDIETNIGFI